MEPIGFDLSDPRMVPTAGAFTEELSRLAAPAESGLVFGVEPGALETFSLSTALEGQFAANLQDPIAEGLRMAMEGKKTTVLISGIETLLRGWPDLRRAAELRLDMKVVQLSGGLMKGDSDSSPVVVEDYGLVSAIPRLPLLSPADANESRAVARWCQSQPGGGYIRLSTFPGPVFIKQFPAFNYGIAGTLTRRGWDISILGHGPVMGTLVRCLEDLELDQISVRLLNVSTLRPFDRPGILRAAQDTRRLLTVEDHQIASGLGSAVKQALAVEALPVAVRSLGIRDEWIPDPLPDDPHRYFGMRSADLLKAVRELLATSM